MKSTKAASRYAKSLLEIAIEQNKMEAILGDMNFLLQTNEDSHDLELLMASPVVNASKKIEIFDIVFNQFDETTKKFIRLITKNGREYMLPEIARTYDALVKEYKGIVPITIISAAPLDAAVKDQIVAKIKSTVSGTLEVEEKIDESLIGGFVVRMGDMQIDASIANQFNNLKQRLTR